MAPFDKEGKVRSESQEKVEPAKEPEIAQAQQRKLDELRANEIKRQIEEQHRMTRQLACCSPNRGDFLREI